MNASIQHVHVHILPRRPGDFEGDEIYAKLQAKDANDDAKYHRSADEMANEAQVYRRLFPTVKI